MCCILFWQALAPQQTIDLALQFVFIPSNTEKPVAHSHVDQKGIKI